MKVEYKLYKDTPAVRLTIRRGEKGSSRSVDANEGYSQDEFEEQLPAWLKKYRTGVDLPYSINTEMDLFHIINKSKSKKVEVDAEDLELGDSEII